MIVTTPTDFREILSRDAGRRLLVRQDGTPVTAGTFLATAETIGTRLLGGGLKPGDRVLACLENSETFLALYAACSLAGLVVCPLDPATPPSRRAQIQREIDARQVITDPMLASLSAEPTAPPAELPAGDPHRDFVILYSSGTTGSPKGIVHTTRSLLDSARSFATLSGLSGRSAIYHHFPMYYMAGLFNMFLCPLVAGATIVLGPRFSPATMARFWDLPMRHGVNHLTLTPTMALSLTRLYRTDDRLLDHLAGYEAVISTGSILYDAVAESFRTTFPVSLRSCYGVTEVGGSITLQSWDEALAGPSVGRWTPDVRISVEGTAENPGEIRVHTPFMMRGYLTEGRVVSPFDDHGRFATGDLGYVSDGALFITGRTNDAVKKGGEFVSLAAIENLALGTPGIADAAAVAVPDEYWGNRLVLFYVPTGGADPDGTEAALARNFDDHLRKVERPDRLIAVPWLPKTAIGKTRKAELVARYTI